MKELMSAFYKKNEVERLSQGATCVYMLLAYHSDKGEIRLSDRTIGLHTGLCKYTVTAAKRELKNRGLIDFKTNPRRKSEATRYILKFFSAEKSTGQATIQKTWQAPVFPIPSKEASKGEDREGSNEKVSALSSSASAASACACASLSTWQAEMGTQLSSRQIEEMAQYEREYGVGVLRGKIEAAKDACKTDVMTFKYFKAYLSNERRSVKKPSLQVAVFEYKDIPNDDDYSFKERG